MGERYEELAKLLKMVQGRFLMAEERLHKIEERLRKLEEKERLRR